EDNNFRLWAKSLDPQFEIPCVNTIKTIIFNFYNSIINQIIDLISKTSDTVILDMGELDKYNASNIIKLVNLVLNKFNIDHSKIFTIITDNSLKVKSAVQQLNITNIKCTRHTLQLSVNLGLKEVDNLISKCKSLIAILSKEKNINSFMKLNYKLLQRLKQLLDIIKDVDTYWNSILYAIEHLMYLKPIIIQLYSTLTNHTIRKIRKGAETMGSFILSTEEFELLGELIEILFPFNEVLYRKKYKAILVKETILDNLIECWRDPNENMCHQFNELCLTPTSNDNINDNLILAFSHSCKKFKMSLFFKHLRTETLMLNPMNLT
ncbi:5191_t:CDS:2, partial [Cetraspora pellucida]